jgi:co-chaperonin GroES (HSP10)
MTNIEPLGGLVLITRIEETDKTTKSGLVIAASVVEQNLFRGTIVKLGPGERDQNGVIHPLPLNIGDVIIYNDIHATEITDNSGEKFYFISWRNLFGTENNG